MNCPWCGLTADPADLHGHFGEQHGDVVTLAQTTTGMHTYSVKCPICGESYDRRIKPHVADDTFLAEFDREIRLVALDMLVCHLIVEHEPDPEPEITQAEESGD